MRSFGLLILIIGLVPGSCNQSNQSITATENQTEKFSHVENSNDKDEIQKLIRQVLKWADSNNSIDLLPVVTDSQDSVYIGFDMVKHSQNLQKLTETDFFTHGFVENYDQIILTLDRKMRDKEFEEWAVGYLPTFKFANDHVPWCNCQDNLDWDLVEVKVNNLTGDQGELVWNWGNLDPAHYSSWKEFEYNFSVVRENQKWKISYMEGFDLNKSIQ